MRDLEALSDQELEAIAAGKATLPKAQAPSVDLESLSDEELLTIASGKGMPNPSYQGERTLGDGIMGTIAEVGRKYDSYMGAPVRSGISKLLETGSLGQAAGAFGKQFGAEPELAPTGKAIARQAGVSSKPLLALPQSQIQDIDIGEPGMAGAQAMAQALQAPRDAVAGFGIEVGADLGNILPAGALAKSGARAAGRGAMAVAKPVAQAAGSAADAVGTAIMSTRPAQKAAKAASVLKETVENTSQSLSKLFNPKQADDFAELTEIAAKNGIDTSLLPEAVEFGPDSIITRASRQRAEGVLGQKKLEAFREGLNQVQTATDLKIQNIGGGPPMGAVDAGNMLRQGFDDAAERLFDGVDLTYKSVQQYAPGLRINRTVAPKLASSLNGIEKYAKGLIKRAITATDVEQGRQLLRAVNGVRAGNGTVKQAVEAMQNIGRYAFKKPKVPADIPPDIEKLRDLYFDISDAVLKTVELDVNPEFAAEIIANNKAMTDFFRKQSKIKNIVKAENLSPEGVFKALIQNGNSETAATIKQLYTPEQVQKLKAGFLDNLIKRNEDGTFSFSALYNAMRNKRPVMEALFEPQELKDMLELVRLGERFGQPILSTSGTGASNVFKSIVGSVQDGLTNDTIIEGLKERARKGTTSIAAPQTTAIQRRMIERLGPAANRPIIELKRTAADDTLKGAQVYSLQKGQAGRGVAGDDEEESPVKRRLKKAK